MMAYETIPEKIINTIFKYPFTSISLFSSFIFALLYFISPDHIVSLFAMIFLFLISIVSEVSMDKFVEISKYSKEKGGNVNG
ncbi:MAG: hypothetical protein ACPL6C_00605 [bacterium]